MRIPPPLSFKLGRPKAEKSAPAGPQEHVGYRFEALDVLRGLAVLGMGLSGMLPNDGLPGWMYHTQLPPPTHQFDPTVFGISWVDLVFPFFLFSMGAAIPIAIGRRLEKGEPIGKIILGLLGRGLLLAAYALIGQDLRPMALSAHPDTQIWIMTLLGFVLISFMLVRWPQKVPKPAGNALTAIGWIGAAALILTWTYPDGLVGFSNFRSDVILIVLANVAVSGGLIWLATRANPTIRWVCIGLVAAVFLTMDKPGLGKVIWDWDPTQYLAIRKTPSGRFLPILYHFEYHKYLLIVLPGTFVGDMIVRMLGRPKPENEEKGTGTLMALSLIGLSLVAVACTGLFSREVIATTLYVGALLFAVQLVKPGGGSRVETLSRNLYSFGTPFLLVGLLAEPLGGGIRKDSPTFSYYLVTVGLASVFLASLVALSGLKTGKVWRTLAETGMNPIMGYLVITNLIFGIVGITGIEAYINAHTINPTVLTTWAAIKTLGIALVTAWFTRRRIFLRA